VFKIESQHIVALTLLVLIFFKVSALHIYVHDDSCVEPIENCEICDAALEIQNGEYLFQDGFLIERPNEIVGDTTTSQIVSQTNTSTSIHFRLFERPPPTPI